MLRINKFILRTESLPSDSVPVPQLEMTGWSANIKNWLADVGVNNVYVPWSAEELVLYGSGCISNAQIGYGLSADGAEQSVAWPDHYLVIATALSDPICVDTSVGESRVLFARHGEGIWCFHEICDNLNTFDDALACWLDVSQNRYEGDILTEDCSLKLGLLEDVNKGLSNILNSKQIKQFMTLLDG